jgi:hypothetical protein
MKQCLKCFSFLDVSEFVTDKRRKDKLYPYCKACSKVYYEQNRQRLLEQKKEYSNRPEIKEKIQQYQKKRYLNNKEQLVEKRIGYYSNPEKRKSLLLWKSKERALKEGFEHTITLDDIVIPELCPYLNVPLTNSLGEGQLLTNSSLDRIDNRKGYIPGNVQVISRLANTMKNSATMEQLILFSQNVLKLHGIQGSNVDKYIEVITNANH